MRATLDQSCATPENRLNQRQSRDSGVLQPPETEERAVNVYKQPIAKSEVRQDYDLC